MRSQEDVPEESKVRLSRDGGFVDHACVKRTAFEKHQSILEVESPGSTCPQQTKISVMTRAEQRVNTFGAPKPPEFSECR